MTINYRSLGPPPRDASFRRRLQVQFDLAALDGHGGTLLEAETSRVSRRAARGVRRRASGETPAAAPLPIDHRHRGPERGLGGSSHARYTVAEKPVGLEPAMIKSAGSP